MSLSVIQRILSGFSILLLLLIVVASAGFFGIRQIEGRLNIVTGEIANIVATSNQLQGELMQSNAVMLQYLLSNEEAVLGSLEQKFDDFHNQFIAQADALNALLSDREAMQTQLLSIRQDAGRFFVIADEAFLNHGGMLENRAFVLDKKLDLKDSVLFAKEDLAVLAEDGDTPEIKFAASYMLSQMESLEATVNDYFDQNDIDYLDVLYGSMLSTFNGINEKMQYVDDENIAILIQEVENSIIPDDGVVMRYRHLLSMQAKSGDYASQLSSTMEQISQYTDALLVQVNEVRTKAKVEASGAATFSLTLALAIVIVSIVVALVVALWVSRSIKRPLSAVMSVLGQIAEGDFTKRVDIISKDEFGELSSWVNDLVQKLEDVMIEISKASTKVATSAKNSAAIANQSKALMGAQNEQTTSVATAMTEMAATVHEVAKSSETALYQVQQVDSRAKENRQQMDVNVSAIESLVVDIESATQAVNLLDEHSQNIGKILEVIQGIAEQTNLLALNAAIEAARAGEQGRGFAVVADEVRTLATRTHSSTEEIQIVITQLQNGVKQTVNSMSQSCSSAYDSVKKAQSVGTSLQEMQAYVTEIRDLTTQIATAAEQQSHVAHDISESVHQIADMSEQAAASADQTAQDSGALEVLAQHQTSLLSQFKVSSGAK